MRQRNGKELVGVVGAGTMGAGICQVALEAGHEVVVHDVDPTALDAGLARIRAGLERRAAGLGLDADSTDEWVDGRLAGLREADTLDAVAAEADVVIEAALEDLELKQTIFERLDGSSGPDALLATNTSALSIDAVAQATSHPDRVLGLHFFNPAPVMKLVEVVTAPRTRPDAAAVATQLVTSWGKTAVQCADAPGFIVNRVNRPFTLEALRILDAGDAPVEQIDLAVVDAGFPMGPFALMDLVGIEVNLAAARSLYERFGHEPRFQPSPTQERLVEEERLGRKAGVGFYDYGADGRSVGVSREFAGHPVVDGTTDEEIVDRIVMGVINEAYYALGEAVADRHDIDLALRLGAGHPRGPFERVADLGGSQAVRERLVRLSAKLGSRFAPAPALLAEA
jgi:3-hydroxybutyryl-CoA dehydrogenase